MSTSDSFLTLYQLDPANIRLRVWILYRKLYATSLKTRFSSETKTVDSNLSWFKRRILLHNILQQYDLLNIKHSLREEWTFLESLIIFLMDIDPKIKPPPNLPSIPPLFPEKDKISVVLPGNPTGTSCFCDVVFVAMFIATNKYDRILSGENLFEYPWADKQLENRNFVWIKAYYQVKDSACYLTQLDKAKENENQAKMETKKTAKDFQKSIFEIVKRIRSYAGEEQNKVQESEFIAFKISQLREKLEKECGIVAKSGGRFIQEDTTAFFLNILAIGGWHGTFLSVIMGIEITELGQVTIYPFNSEIPSLSITDSKGGTPLQTIIDENWFTRRVIIVENMLARVSQGFVRISDPFVFLILRGIGVGTIEKQKRISTIITFPEDDTIKLSIMHYQNEETQLPSIPKTTVSPISNLSKTTWNYKIFAIACHTSLGSLQEGHYVLYFKYPGRDNEWFLYDDIHPIPKRVNIHKDQDHKQTIEQDGYLFWADRTTILP
ncbi:MAG TPA: hypothetical protein ENI23_13805 [bacterium]|nr:hypothetical protein [bacterium]